ncbi:tonb-dependent receptor [Anopheles sinensis]|uniref:Tonb-dependent receptor n=1 Tax=Anopheles sinensis TaxID=74873 RepID=A0A084WF75_ANOSI|nr:tonb-dependent receptor [Anopheles sinensis]
MRFRCHDPSTPRLFCVPFSSLHAHKPVAHFQVNPRDSDRPRGRMIDFFPSRAKQTRACQGRAGAHAAQTGAYRRLRKMNEKHRISSANEGVCVCVCNKSKSSRLGKKRGEGNGR